MTLTPPRIGDLAARSPTQWLLDKKSPDESNADGANVARLLDGAPEKVRCVRGGHDGTANATMLAGCASGRSPCSPVPDTRDVICKAASCAGVRSRNLAAHESPPSPRVTRARRPGSLNITASCVRHGGGAVTGVAVLTLALGQRNASASLPGIRPARPSLGAPQKVWRVNQTLLDETSQRRRRKNQRMNQTPRRKKSPD